MDLLLNAPPPPHSLLDTEHRRLVEAMDDLSRGCSVYWVLFDINNQYHLHVLYRASTKGKNMFGNMIIHMYQIMI